MSLVGFLSADSRDLSMAPDVAGTMSAEEVAERWAIRMQAPADPTESRAQVPGIPATGVLGEVDVADLHLGVWIYVTALPSTSEEKIVDIRRTGGTVGDIKAECSLTNAGNLIFYARVGLSEWQTLCTVAVQTGRWWHLEIRVGTGAGATCNWALRINSCLVGGGSDAQFGTGNAAVIYLGKAENYYNGSLDVAYAAAILDDAEFHGPLASARAAPLDDGACEWIPVPGPDNWPSVDEVPHDEDDTRCYSATLGARDQYELQHGDAANALGTIVAVIGLAVCRATKIPKVGLWIGEDSTWTSPPASFVENTYTARACLGLVSLGTGLPWTQADLAALELGVECCSAGLQTHCTTAMIIVVFRPHRLSGVIARGVACGVARGGR